MRLPPPHLRRRPASPPAAERGFSLIELLVAMLIAVEILVAGAIAFDLNNRMAQVQTQITDLQQSLRIAQTDMARLVRMAGRGGLPSELSPGAVYDPTAAIPDLTGLALEVRSNVTSANHNVSRSTTTPSPAAIDGTDILTIRGCLSTSIYQLNPLEFDWDPDSDGVANQASLVVNKISVAGVRQPLKPLLDEINAYPAGAAVKGKLILVSPESRSVYGIAEITGVPAVTGSASDPDSLTFTTTLKLDTNSPLNPIDTDLVVPARRFPPKMTASYGCFLEEYRYYVYETDGDALTPEFPRLARARFEPGTEEPYQGDTSNFKLDLADGVFDLQVALGLDTDYPSTIATTPGSFGDDSDNLGVDDTIFEGPVGDASRAQDDWLYNDSTDVLTDTQYTTHGSTTQAGLPVQVYFVRVSTWARTRRADPKYEAPLWTPVEDESLNPTYWTGEALQFRKRELSTIVDMRNI